MDKRTIIAIVLSLLVLVLYPYFMKLVYPPAEKAAVPVEEKAPEETAGPEVKQEPAKPAPARTSPLEEEVVTVETPLYRAEFTSSGGGVKSWELKKYRVAKEPDSPRVNVVAEDGGERALAIKLLVNEKGFLNVNLRPSRKKVSLSEGESGELKFTGVTPDGIRVEKTYLLSSDAYSAQAEVRVTNGTGRHLKGEVSIPLVSAFVTEEKAYYHAGPLVRTGKKLLRQDPDEPGLQGREKLQWLGLEDKYFLLALIPETDAPLSWTTEVPSLQDFRAEARLALDLPAGGEAFSYKYKAFIGPKEYDLLLRHKAGLEESIEFGFFSFLAKPLLVVLNFFKKYLVNYGVAIALLTIIIKVVFYPLTKSSLKSMKDMQKIQPQLVALKEKYKDNKEKMNKEVMELYKRYKINPLSGCLPMILQIPVFIALYEVLYVAIELRHAPLFLWITDLSEKDPYYVTPILMGGSMFLQQKMTPTGVDPMQARVMLFMPIIFTVMFINFPSGLVFYWLVNNIISIAQQYWITGREKARA